MGITTGWNNFKDSIVNGQKRNIKGTTSQIEDKDVLFSFFFVKTIGDGSSSWFVDDSHDIQTGNGSSIFGSLTLSIIEISRDCDNSMSDFLSKVGFSNILFKEKKE